MFEVDSTLFNMVTTGWNTPKRVECRLPHPNIVLLDPILRILSPFYTPGSVFTGENPIPDRFFELKNVVYGLENSFKLFSILLVPLFAIVYLIMCFTPSIRLPGLKLPPPQIGAQSRFKRFEVTQRTHMPDLLGCVQGWFGCNHEI